MTEYRSRCIIVGVTPSQPPAVVQQAARFARAFEASLVCAHVAAGNYVVRENPDGSVESRPIDTDQPVWDNAVFDDALADRIRRLASDAAVPVEFRELAGDIAYALGRLADVLAAEMIIVGSRRGGLRTSMHDFFSGSVAVHLAHRQPRPLIIIPLDPRPQGRLPWEQPHV